MATERRATATTVPELGVYAVDEITGDVGKVEAITAGYVLLGRIGGGKPWQAERDHVRSATIEEGQSAGVRVANARMFDPRQIGGAST